MMGVGLRTEISSKTFLYVFSKEFETLMSLGDYLKMVM